MRLRGVGPMRLKRMKRALRRETPSADRPCSPRACETSQRRRIVQSRVKPPSAHGSASRVASSRPRTSLVEAEGSCLSLFNSEALAFQTWLWGQTNPNIGPLSFPPSIAFPFQRNQDAGVAKILPPPVLLAPRHRRISADSVNTSRSPSPSPSKASRTRGGRYRRDRRRLNPHRARSLPTRTRKGRTYYS